MKVISVRELGGEFYAEIEHTRLFRQGKAADTIQEIVQKEYSAADMFVDLFMSILARHIGELIVNDSDIPVEPLEPILFDS